MKRLLCEKLPEPHRPSALSETEAHHAVRVLRLRDGEKLEALDGRGRSAIVTLRTQAGPPRLEFSEAGKSASVRLPALTLELAILKGDAMEWVIEKSVELGVRAVVPVMSDYSVVQVSKKGPEAFQQRWQKIADQALKQCGRLEAMRVAEPTDLGRLLAETAPVAALARAWCDETASTDAATPELADWLASPAVRDAKELRLLIGPEGGWSPEEHRLLSSPAAGNTLRVGLGELILRAETAAIFASSLAVSALRSRMKTGSAAPT